MLVVVYYLLCASNLTYSEVSMIKYIVLYFLSAFRTRSMNDNGATVG